MAGLGVVYCKIEITRVVGCFYSALLDVHPNIIAVMQPCQWSYHNLARDCAGAIFQEALLLLRVLDFSDMVLVRGHPGYVLCTVPKPALATCI